MGAMPPARRFAGSEPRVQGTFLDPILLGHAWLFRHRLRSDDVVLSGNGERNMSKFDDRITSAIQTEREVELTTFGRKTGNPSRRILWVYGDSSRVFIRSGGGLGRDWPQNLLANGRAILHVNGMEVPVTAVHVTDIAASRRAGELGRAKYAGNFVVTSEGEEPTPGERATFELLFAEA